MFRSFFTGRSRQRGVPSPAAEQRLRQLLQARPLRPYRFSSRCEIGPFIVTNVCQERSLVVELRAQSGLRERQAQRAAFLAELGYAVLHVCVEELHRHPGRTVRRIRAALRSTASRRAQRQQEEACRRQ
jgi:very-short-patch-repair endonuclease